MPEISVVVPARNALGTIERTLGCLAAQDLEQPFEVIVVDNGSDDDTAAVAERAGFPTRVIRQQALRPGAARNRGAAEAGSDRIAFTDADCFPSPGWLRAGMAALERADLVQGAVHADSLARVGPFDRTVSVTRETGLYETANLFVRRDTFERVGGFEDWILDDLSKPFGEDVWFAWRARRSGARVCFSEDALVEHAVFPRGALDYIAERRRLALFPRLVARIPELRRTFLRSGLFLSPRSAAFDLAVVGAAVALASRRAAPLAVAAPYARMALADRRRWGRRAPAVVAAEIAADATGLAALLAGSLRNRCIVL